MSSFYEPPVFLLFQSYFLPIFIFNESVGDGEQLPPRFCGLVFWCSSKNMIRMPQRTFLKMHVLYLHF